MPTLDWIGKSKVINHHLDVPFRVLDLGYAAEGAGPLQNHHSRKTLEVTVSYL